MDKGHGVSADEYLEPAVAPGLPWRDLPVIDARDPGVADLVLVVDGDPERFAVPIVPWPVNGGRPLDPDTGTGGGVIEGTFSCWWEGARLYGRNQAVGGHYLLGWSRAPEQADGPHGAAQQVVIWHVNYHPDGGQLFASREGHPFLVPAIPPGVDPDLQQAVALYCDGTYAVCLRPGVWHDGVFPAKGDGTFLTRQGAVHARISADLGSEFGCLLRIPLGPPPHDRPHVVARPHGRQPAPKGTYRRRDLIVKGGDAPIDAQSDRCWWGFVVAIRACCRSSP